MNISDYMNGNDLRTDQGFNSDLRADLGQDGYAFNKHRLVFVNSIYGEFAVLDYERALQRVTDGK